MRGTSIRLRWTATLLLCLLPLAAIAQEPEQAGIVQALLSKSEGNSPCNIFIKGNSEPKCIHLIEAQLSYNELPGTLFACQGSTITYTAYATKDGQPPVKWEWQVDGHMAHTANSDGTIIVTWGDGDYGILTVTVFWPDGSTCTKTTGVKLIERPTIAVTTTPAYVEQPDGTKVIYVCKGESVEFTELSSTTNTDIEGYHWKSEMGGISSSPNYSIEQVWADDAVLHRVYNNCGCYDEERYTIRMMEGEILDLGCYGTVCQGATVTYTATKPSCSQYFWYIDGGSIISGQNSPQVTVQWDDPHDGYGVIALDGNLCGNHACPTMLSKKIPIIENQLAIKGQSTACVGEAVIYSIPLFGSTEYHWNITPQTGVTPAAVNGANEVLYVFDQPGTYQISVSYKCDFLECGEFTSAPLTVTVRPRLSIAGEDRICISNPCDLATSPAAPADWTVYDMDNGNMALTNVPSQSSLSIPFPHPGRYRIVAHHDSYCDDAVFLLIVQDTPPAPTMLDIDPSNPHTACRYDGVRLRAHPRNPNHSIVWRPVCDDSTPSEVSGNDVTINYASTVCDVNAYTYDRLLGCLSSTPYVQEIKQRTLAPITMSRHIEACPGTVISWGDGDIPPQEGVLYEWSVQHNMQHCASVQGDHMTNAIVFTVNEQTSGVYGYTFYMLLGRTVCNKPYFDTFYIHVNDHAPTTVGLAVDTSEACPGGPFTFTGTGGDPATYRWRVDGKLVPFVGNPLVRAFSAPGTHRVTVLNNGMDECTNLRYYDSATVTILVHPTPVVNRIDFDSHSVIADVAEGNYTYRWYYNDTLQPGEVEYHMDTVGDGIYRCTVTNEWGCSSSKSKAITPSTAPTICDDAGMPDTTYDFCNATLQLVSPVTGASTIQWSCSGTATQRKMTVNPSDRHQATIAFKDVGVYLIKSYTTDDDCQISSITHTVHFIPRFTFEKRCDRIVIHNNSLSLHDDLLVKFRINDVDSVEFGCTEESHDYPVSSSGNYTFALDIVVAGHHYSCEYATVQFTSYDGATLAISTANTHNQHLTCSNTPIELTVTPDPYFPIASATWYFGDGSQLDGEGNTICHTFGSGTYQATVTVHTPNGCNVNSGTFSIISNENELDGYKLKTIEEMISCPNTDRYIRFEKQGILLTTRDFYWDGTTQPVQTFQYATHQTGLYHGWVVSDAYCHVQDNINVKFKNAPTALIVTDKRKYCTGEEVMLHGATGPDSNNYAFAWEVQCMETADMQHYHTATVILTPTTPGIYRARLCVTDIATGCFACSEDEHFTVYPTPDAPSLGFGTRRCMDNPPVELVGHSPLTPDIYWSNGNTGQTAYYFTPGVATAWYYEPSTGCRSKEAHLTIDAKPDFDALLTGCYEKCSDYFKNPQKLNVHGLTRHQQVIEWTWLQNNEPIDGGTGNYTDTPFYLKLPWFGQYHMVVNYNGDLCSTTSPSLIIQQKEQCDCQGMEVSYKYDWYTKECRLYYQVEVTVCNHSDSTVCIKHLDQLTKSEYIHVASNDFMGAMLQQGDCYTFGMTLAASQLIPSSAVSFRFTDDCNNCTTDFAIDLMPNKVDCDTLLVLKHWHIRPDLSNSTASYIDFVMDVSPAQNVLAFWSDPSMVFDYWYDGAALVHGLLMFDNAVISQLTMEDGRICFYAITCEGDKLCQRQYGIPAKAIYETLKKMGIEPKNAMNTNPTDETEAEMLMPPLPNAANTELRLMPNPTTGEVNVIGTTDEVVEVLVMDMNGRQMALFEETADFNVATLPSGMYIVRIKTWLDKTEQITYLKLVKQ